MNDHTLDSLQYHAGRRGGKSLLRPASKAPTPTVTIDENNLVIDEMEEFLLRTLKRKGSFSGVLNFDIS